jgi:hypothetical protein
MIIVLGDEYLIENHKFSRNLNKVGKTGLKWLFG